MKKVDPQVEKVQQKYEAEWFGKKKADMPAKAKSVQPTPEAPKDIVLRFKTLTNKEFEVEVKTNETIGNLKQKIEAAQGVPVA